MNLRAYTVRDSGMLVVWCEQCGMHHKISRDGLSKLEQNFGYRVLVCGASGYLINNGMADAQQVAEVENAGRGTLLRGKLAHSR